MRIALFLALIITGIWSSVHGQQADSLHVKRVVLTTSAFEYFPGRLNAGNFNLGADMYVANNFSVYANVGVIKSYGPSGGNWFQLSSQNTSGVKIQLEGRHYLNRHRIFDPAVLIFWPHIFQYKSQSFKNTGYYLALHTVYQQTNTKRDETVPAAVGHPSFGQYIQNDYTVERSAIGLHIKIGYQSIKSYGLVVDYAVGLGLQYISSSSNDKLGSGSDEDWPWNKAFDEGSGLSLSPVYQIRIGWGFGNR